MCGGEHSGLAAHNKGSCSCDEAQAPWPLRLVDGRSLAFHALATWLGLGLRLGLEFGFGLGLGLVHALATMAAWLRLPVGGATWGEAWRTPLHMHPAAPPADAPARRCSSAADGSALGIDEPRDAALAEAAGLGSGRPSALLNSQFSASSLPRICWSCWWSVTERCSSSCSSNDHLMYTPTSVDLIGSGSSSVSLPCGGLGAALSAHSRAAELVGKTPGARRVQALATIVPCSSPRTLVCAGTLKCDLVLLAKLSSLWNDAFASSSTRERRAAARASIMRA